MIALSVTWTPADQSWLFARQSRRGLPLGNGGWQLPAAGLLLSLGALVAGRVAAWAVMDPTNPAPLLWQLSWHDGVLAGIILVVFALLTLAQRLTERFTLVGAFEAQLAAGREPLLGDVAVTLTPERATLRARHWESGFDASLLSAVEDERDYLILYFGSVRPLILPRRDLTTAEILAVQNWAADVQARVRQREGITTVGTDP